jgi:uncharacterized protein
MIAILAWLPGTASASGGVPGLALVIDDLGYNLAHGRRAIALPGPLTVAVLPFTPNGATLAALATDAGKEVILHQPMQTMAGSSGAPGELTADMSDADLRRQLGLALAEIPQAIGLSNHTGSLLTAQPRAMRSLMEEVGVRGLFFLDSRTTPATVAQEVAHASGVPALRRDVFLDHSSHPADIARAFERAIAIARQQGHAILIAHPYAASLRFLEAELPLLEARGIRQISLTGIIGRLPAVPEAQSPKAYATTLSPRRVPARACPPAAMTTYWRPFQR